MTDRPDAHARATARLLGDTPREAANGPRKPERPASLTLVHFAISADGDECDGCRTPLYPYQYVTGRSDGHIFCCNECERQHPNVNIPTYYPDDPA